MEYSVENQIANRNIAMGKEKNRYFIKILPWSFVTFHSFHFEGETFQLNFDQCSLLWAMWHMISVMWRIQTGDMWTIMYYRDILQICLFELPCFESISKISPPPPPCWKKNPCWSTNMSKDKLHTMLLLPILEGGTYTLTVRTVYKNLPEPAWFGK